jgi:hypothetical protein
MREVLSDLLIERIDVIEHLKKADLIDAKTKY